ncbi:MAG: GIY-YIG nuclease family protein, partial [Acidobacteriota bacterium]
ATSDERIREGIKRIGQWRMSETGLDFASDHRVTEPNVLYAFVSGREVLYVGKTSRPIAKRLYGYQNPGKMQLTNVYCNREICRLLTEKRPVEVFVRHAEKLSRIGSFAINEAAALEDAIIRELRPPWNRTGKKR